MQRLLFILSLISLLQGCTFSLAGFDFGTAQTFSVEQFETTAGNAPPTIGQQFSERLKQRILSDTKLQYRPSGKADIEFAGAITSYQISPIAPQPGQTVALQRLTIKMEVQCKNNTKEIKNWPPSFSRFADFAADADLSAVETQLVKEIYDQIIEDVFNKAFTNW